VLGQLFQKVAGHLAARERYQILLGWTLTAAHATLLVILCL
jgi:hypothetical protein